MLVLPASARNYLSPCDIALADGQKILCLPAATGRQLMEFDLISREVTHRTSLPGEPTGPVQSQDGKTLYVTGGGHEGRVWIVRDGEVAGEIDAAVARDAAGDVARCAR